MNEKYPLALPEGTVLAGQYVVKKVLGQGGFGITYGAIDHKTGDWVAVKEFFPDTMASRTNHTTVSPFSGERGEHYVYGKTCFLQEAETLAKFIGNENIVRIHSYFEENGTAYFVMDFIEGISFDEYLRQRGGKIPYEEAARILIPVMDALSAVHSKGIIHRDVTPDNIYITKEGVVKLLDFGAARYSLGDQSRSLDVILKHGFAPKEQYTRRGKQGPYTDIYSLGATFYFALTGKRPPDSVERMDEDELVPPSTLGAQFSSTAEDAILQALSVQPADRFQSMASFKNALTASQEAGNVQSAPAEEGRPAVAQTFFNAPEPSGISPTAAADSVPPPGGTSGVPAGGSSTKPARNPGNKKLLLLIPAAAVVILLGVLIFKFDRLDKAPAPDEDEAPSNETVENEQPPAVSTDTLPGGNITLDPSDIPTFSDSEPSDPEPSDLPQTAALSGDWSVVGNYSENMMNWGLLSGRYVVDKGWTSITDSSTGTNIVENVSSIHSLSLVDGRLYFLANGSAYVYEPKTGAINEVQELSGRFSGSISRLMLTKDFYVICCQNTDGTATVYRILRAGGEAAACCTISSNNCFTMSDDGWIYYISRENNLSCVRRMRLDTLEISSSELVHLISPEYEYCNPIVAGDYLYLFYYDAATLSTYAISRIDRERGYIEDGVNPAWLISSELNTPLLANGFGFNVNHKNHIIYFYVFTLTDDGVYIPYLYKLDGYENGNFHTEMIIQNSYDPNITYSADGSYQLHFWHMEPDDETYYLYYQSFDKDGNQIENNS